MAITQEELRRDAKLVYSGNLNDLVRLCDKYGVSTTRTKMIATGEIDITNYAGIGIANFPSKSDQQGIRSTLYATIKEQMRP